MPRLRRSGTLISQKISSRQDEINVRPCEMENCGWVEGWMKRDERRENEEKEEARSQLEFLGGKGRKGILGWESEWAGGGKGTASASVLRFDSQASQLGMYCSIYE
jgi:hypothetical protein